MSGETQPSRIPSFDEQARKLLFYGYMVRIIGDIIQDIAGIGRLITGIGWAKHYGSGRKPIYAVVAVISVISGAVALYSAAMGVAAVESMGMPVVGGRMNISDFAETVRLTASSLCSTSSYVSLGLTVALLIVEALAILDTMKTFRTFNAFAWILLVLAGVAVLIALACTPSTCTRLLSLADRMDRYVEEHGDQPLSGPGVTPSEEVIGFVTEYASIVLPLSATLIIGILLRLIGHILVTLGFSRIPKYIEKLRIIEEARAEEAGAAPVTP